MIIDYGYLFTILFLILIILLIILFVVLVIIEILASPVSPDQTISKLFSNDERHPSALPSRVLSSLASIIIPTRTRREAAYHELSKCNDRERDHGQA